MFKVRERVAVIHLHRVGKERRREAIRIDTIEKITPKHIQTNKAKFNTESGFQIESLRARIALSQVVATR